MVSVTSRLTTGVTETAGGGAVPWAAATLHDTAIMSAQKAAFGTADPSIEVLLAARVTPRILRFTGIRRGSCSGELTHRMDSAPLLRCSGADHRSVCDGACSSPPIVSTRKD